MALGKAFIEVHADTAPFARELGNEIRRALRDVENTTVKQSGDRIGKKLATDIGNGINRNRSSIGKGIRNGLNDGLNEGDNQGFATRFLKGIIDTIDDGLSGLPAEVKAVLGGALIAAAPLVGGVIAQLITGAIAAGITVGVAGLGILAAAQFTEIREQFSSIFTQLRNQVVEDAQVLFPVLTAGLDLVRDRLNGLRPVWQAVFAGAEDVILPVLDALLGFVESFSTRFVEGFDNLDAFGEELGKGLREIGNAAGYVIASIANDDDAVDALTDLLILVRDLVVVTGALVKGFLNVYGAIRAVAQLTDGLGILGFELDEFDDSSLRSAEAAAAMGRGIRGTVDILDSEQKALEEANKVLSDYINKTFGAWDANIAFEQQLDDMSEVLRRNRGALDLNSQAGRDNQKAIRDAAAALIEQRDSTISLTGNTEFANQTFATNRKRLEDQAAAAGISRTRFRELTDAVLSVPPPKDTGVTQGSVNRARSLLDALKGIGAAVARAGQAGARAATGFQAYAEGGIVNRPTLGLVGEAGPEAVLPLNNPGRAAQILSQTGLGGQLNPTVNVYIGNQQLDAYIDNRVDSRTSVTARELAYGGRGV